MDDDQQLPDDGIAAYHGSPHDFERFDTSKIGTGEGAQAYGHGLYFAQSEPIAKSYRDTLSVEKAINDLPGYTQGAAKLIQRKGDAGEQMFRQHYDDLGPEKVEQAIKDAKETIANPPKGHMYEVHINAHPDHFLDWDRPVREQPHIMNAIDSHIGDAPSVLDRFFGHQNATGRDLHEIFGGEHKAKAVADKFHSMGIKGIKYLDAGSRDQSDKPSRNYVVFDDKLVNVKRKYAKGGIVQGGAPIHALHLTSKFGNSLQSAVNQAKAATRRRP